MITLQQVHYCLTHVTCKSNHLALIVDSSFVFQQQLCNISLASPTCSHQRSIALVILQCHKQLLITLCRIAEIFRGRKISPSSATFVLQKHFMQFFCQCGKGHYIIVYVIINTGEKIHRRKVLVTRKGGEIGEIVVKISSGRMQDFFKESSVIPSCMKRVRKFRRHVHF